MGRSPTWSFDSRPIRSPSWSLTNKHHVQSDITINRKTTYAYWSAISYAQDDMDSMMHGLDQCDLNILLEPCIGQSIRHSPNPSHPRHRIFLFGVRFDSPSNLPSKPFAPVHSQAPNPPSFGSFGSCPPSLCLSLVAILGEFPRCLPHQRQRDFQTLVLSGG